MKNEEKVKNLHEKNYSTGEIANELKMKNSNVSMYLNKIYGKNRTKNLNHKVLNKKYKVNEDYFNSIDTKDKAYFLGLLYADGCISSNSNVIQIALQKEDENILEVFSKKIETIKPLRLIKSDIIKGFDSKKQYKRKEQILMYIHSLKMKKDLIKLGCTPKKSLTLKFPTKEQVSKQFIPDFLRGYFDGDGNIYEGTKNRWSISIAGNIAFCNSLQLIFNENNINSSITKHITNNIYYLRIFGRLNCIDFYNFIYKDSTIYLERKYKKFKKCLNSTNIIRDGNSWKKKK